MSLFKCPECPEVFNFKQTMMAHIKKHSTTISEEKDSSPKQEISVFDCSMCQKSFKYRDALRIHIMNLHGDKNSTSIYLNDVGSSLGDFSNHDKDLVKRLLRECDPGMHLLLSFYLLL